MIYILPPFLSQHARWPEDLASLALLENTMTIHIYIYIYIIILYLIRNERKLWIQNSILFIEPLVR